MYRVKFTFLIMKAFRTELYVIKNCKIRRIYYSATRKKSSKSKTSFETIN